MSVDAVARLTTWQVWHLYLKPAIERARQMKKEANPEGGMSLDDIEVELDPREEWIARESEANPGKDREYWDRVYDLVAANRG